MWMELDKMRIALAVTMSLCPFIDHGHYNLKYLTTYLVTSMKHIVYFVSNVRLCVVSVLLVEHPYLGGVWLANQIHGWISPNHGFSILKQTITSKMNVKINQESNETQQEVVSFSDQTQQWTYAVDTRLDSMHTSIDSADASLENFFSRPIKLTSINWTVGSTFGTTINPWTLYFTNPRVINRICNYNLMRCKLCVRIMINGNGFHYGRALASYRPLHNDDEMIAWRYATVPQDLIAASQRMHVWIDPTKSQGGTLCLPYVYYKNAMNVPDQDWQDMGELDLASVTTLEHANGGTDSVTISVFAWAEDVSLSVPTIAEPGALAPQAGNMDEYEGKISGPANAIARAAGALSTIPTIGNMARATQMAAQAGAAIAKLFGMSRPVDNRGIASYKPSYVGGLSNANVLDTSTKLAYDVKQELTIDPVAIGLGPNDEMSFVSIAQRESYLTQFPWATSAAPETLLWNCYVEPILYDTASPSGVTEYHYTPMAWVARPFENWRGTLKYRFQIVASAFHKGRLKIIYEPYFNTLGASEYNTQQTHIIDLAKERDFTVEIKWGQEYSFLDHRELTFAGLPFSTSFLGGSLHGQANGIIGVYVVNDLTTPSATLSDVSVLVSVSAGDDFEVVNPTNELDRVTFYQPQAGELQFQSGDLNIADGDLTTDESKPVDSTVETDMGLPISKEDDVHAVYFGDPVSSIRQVLKRYEALIVYSNVNETANGLTFYSLSNFPYYRGYAGTASLNNAATPIDPTPYTYSNTTMMNWFTPIFLTRRGGIRYKYIYDNPDNVTGTMSLRRDAEPANTIVNNSENRRDATSSSRNYFESKRTVIGSHMGVEVTPIHRNPVLEVELPFLKNLRFAPARMKNFTLGTNVHNQSHSIRIPASTPGNAALISMVAAAEDFSLGFFQACPVFWSAGDPTPSATS